MKKYTMAAASLLTVLSLSVSAQEAPKPVEEYRYGQITQCGKLGVLAGFITDASLVNLSSVELNSDVHEVLYGNLDTKAWMLVAVSVSTGDVCEIESSMNSRKTLTELYGLKM
jgi:hypothetical protein